MNQLNPAKGTVMDLTRVRAQATWASVVLIPSDAANGMPSATEAGVVDTLLPRALKARPDLSGLFIDVLSRLPADEPADGLQVLRDLGDEEFNLISHMIAGSYFLSEDVRRRLKYPGQQALSLEPDYDEIQVITDRVRARGQRYVAP